MKYFSFATLDDQFENKRLPFGYSEAPAEFQKKIVQILQLLIEKDKILVYIGDILISTDSVESKLKIFKKVLIILKQNDFELNYHKCSFLHKKIEYLECVISDNKITMSPHSIN